MESQQYFFCGSENHPLDADHSNRTVPQVGSQSYSRDTTPGGALTSPGPSFHPPHGPRTGSICSLRHRSMPNPGPDLLHTASSDDDTKGGLVSQAPPSEDFIHEVLAINTLAMQRTKVECLEEAMEMLTEVFDKLSCEDSEMTVGDLQMLDQLRATTLNNMGVTECRRGQPRKALSHFEGSRQLEEKWNIASPSVVLNTCAAYNTLQIFDKATSAALETIEMLRTLELQKKWAKKHAKDEEKERRMGLGLLREVSCAPSSTSSKAHGSGLAGGGRRRGMSLMSSSMVPKTSAERTAAKEEKAMLNAAAFPTVARSENAALWGAAWHNLGVAQINIARQAKDPSEYSNALAILENAMRTTYDKLGIQHPMSVDVTATFRHVRGVLLKNGAYKAHRTMKHAVLPAVDPRVQLLENLKAEPMEGESHARALENQRKEISVTFRGEVTGGRKLVERIDATPYPDGGREAYQQRTPRRHRSHRRGGSFPALLDVPLSFSYNPTLIAATKIYGNPHPLLDAGVGVLSREWTPEEWSGRKGDPQGGSPPSSARRLKRKGRAKRRAGKNGRQGRHSHPREEDFTRGRGGMEGGGGGGPHRPHAGHPRRPGEGRRRHQRGHVGSDGSAEDAPTEGDTRHYTFLSKCQAGRSRSAPHSQQSPHLSQEEEEEERRGKRTHSGEERGKRAAGTNDGRRRSGSLLDGKVGERGGGATAYALRPLEQEVYGSEIPKPAPMVGYDSAEGGGQESGSHWNAYSSPPSVGGGGARPVMGDGDPHSALPYRYPPTASPWPTPLSQQSPPQGQGWTGGGQQQPPPSVFSGYLPSSYPQAFAAVPPLPPLPLQGSASPPYPSLPDPPNGSSPLPLPYGPNGTAPAATDALPPMLASQQGEGQAFYPFPSPASQVPSTSLLSLAEDSKEAWMQSKLVLLAESPAPFPFGTPVDGQPSPSPLLAPYATSTSLFSSPAMYVTATAPPSSGVSPLVAPSTVEEGGGGVALQPLLSQGMPFPMPSTGSPYDAPPPMGVAEQGNPMALPFQASPLPSDAAVVVREEGGVEEGHPPLGPPPAALALAPEVTNALVTDADRTSALWETDAEGPNALFGALWVAADPRLLPKHKSDSPSVPTRAMGNEGNNNAASPLSTAYSGSSRPQVLEITEDGTPSSDVTAPPPTMQALEHQLYSKPALMLYSDEDGARSSSSSMESLTRPYARS